MKKLSSCNSDHDLNLPPPKILKPTEDELETLFKDLSDAGNPVILSIVQPYCEKFVPQSLDCLPKPLTDLFDETLLDVSYPELLEKSHETFTKLKITAEYANMLEKATKSQSNSTLWFRHRAGRITASRFKAAAHTNIAEPSKSLIRAICYPEITRFSTEATKWGCKHEDDARNEYIILSQKDHENFTLSLSGLIVDPSILIWVPHQMVSYSVIVVEQAHWRLNVLLPAKTDHLLKHVKIPSFAWRRLVKHTLLKDAILTSIKYSSK